ncbi:transmembrane protein 186-like [Sinocyclocheilus anshuiensis]|uniref:Transmembrane protein 186 n=1 Tax=Sinocyclocheilus anshuiensis TaxID=1608454 RepID=A0A671QA25_9TELE|nr:PREDICTED: transmembrane protein 186-like [Sinocyclocheilus anshuiensis]XP_016303699.1 PREDICTED: transmembrane protein 186-like [Sinocyclocheilus anshuiensis]XP_016303700.1 PREDICTED: transmembrane protein 186-like [Sinocyclocheilus anshuiensis]XP_016303701.1 PREDICTED: transmembrane protein 186-like [Sinocyclocheilus anshuiensis]XP_016303702.1 PREDICTED: transmembrane protein 186-like [Sinocyclocheilus anshuiensis]XP_016303703.1 PREDICTED: transmembrane protein 186-like [Sinocyclocheilus 
MMSARLIRISRLPLYGCHRAGLISSSHVQYGSDLVHVGRRMPITVTHTVQIQPASFCSDLASRKYSPVYTFPAIKGLRALSRLKLMQTGITVVLLPAVYYLYLQGQASVMLLSYSTGIAVFAGVMLYSISHYVRRVVGMMYLDSTQTVLKVSHLTFWGHRRDIYVPVSDVMTLGDSGDTKGEPILRLKRYSCSDTMYFSTRLGRVVDRNAFEKVFGSLS